MTVSDRVVLGVSGSIAAYKSPEIVRRLRAAGFEVRVAMTPAATRFIGPLTLEAVSNAPVYLDPVARAPRSIEGEAAPIAHTELTSGIEALLVAPASADIIAKIALGLGDDAISVLALAHPADAPLLIAPAMNPRMWANPAVRENIERLERRGAIIIGPDEGAAACGDRGRGRMSEPDEIVARTLRAMARRRAARPPRRILVLSGPTREALDDVRFLSNGSSGRMGAALAGTAFENGEEVTVVSGPAAIMPPRWIATMQVESAGEMLSAARAEVERSGEFDVIISPAAVADLKPRRRPGKPEKTGYQAIEVEPTPDVVGTLAAERRAAGGRPLVVAFTAAEDATDLQAARRKATAHGADAIVVNEARSTMGAASATVTLLMPDAAPAVIGPAPKRAIARELWRMLLG
jgi:phosphopantothenoylcysteine decarboxylase/phosphopantothenate--cysteine ligase